MNIRPTWNCVLIRPEPPKDTSDGGIVLPQSMQKRIADKLKPQPPSPN